MHQCDQLSGLRVGQWLEQHSLDDGEDCRTRSDTQRQGQYADRSEAPISGQPSGGIAQVAEEGINRVLPSKPANLFVHGGRAAQFQTGQAKRLLRRESLRGKGRRRFFQVVSDLVGDFPVRRPGAGKVMIPRLIAALGTDRDRYMTAAELQCYSGIARVISRRGQQCHTDWRRACPKFLRQTFHEWAWYSTRKCSWARQYYDTQRARKKSHHAAVRSLSFKWSRILFRCWKDRSLYDEARYTAALASRRSRQDQPSVKIMWKNIAGFCKPAEIPSENA